MEIMNATSAAPTWVGDGPHPGPAALEAVRVAAQWAVERVSDLRPIVGEPGSRHELTGAAFQTVINAVVHEEGVEFAPTLTINQDFSLAAQVQLAGRVAAQFVAACLSLRPESGGSLVWRQEPKWSAGLQDDGLTLRLRARLAWI